MATFIKSMMETKTMIKRNIWKSMKNSDRIIENLIAPMLTMLIFVYVLGGAMNHVTEMRYVNYMVPGVLILSIAQCSTATAIGVSTDVQKNIIDRFRSMPISTTSILHGHVIESMIRTTVSVLLVFLVATVVGFRPSASLFSWVLLVILLFSFTLMITLVSVAYGLYIKSPEGANSLNIFVMMFIYLSSGFVPTETLPKALRIFADNQPMTFIIETTRRLLLSQPLENHLTKAIAWCVGLLIVSYMLTLYLYKRRVSY